MKLNSSRATVVAALAATAVVASFSSLTARAQNAAKPADTAPVLCAVKGEVINDVSKAAGKADFKGKTYYFCCPGCVSKFSKSDDAAKTKFAKLTELRTDKIVLQKKLDAVNTELASLEGKPGKEEHHAAATKTAAGANVIYCAVTDEEIGTPDKAAGGKAEYKGKTYYFCCAGCKPRFESDPATYAAAADKKTAERAAQK
jgi:Cu+-exporting ATPase